MGEGYEKMGNYPTIKILKKDQFILRASFGVPRPLKLAKYLFRYLSSEFSLLSSGCIKS
jgi:hypothetical protein